MVATKSATVSGQLRPIVKSFTQKPAQCSRICGNWMPRHAGSTTEARTVKAVHPSVAELLHMLILQKQALTIVEVGTSHGLSTIWLAAATRRTGGHVYRVDALPTKTSAAADNLRSAGLADHVTLTTAAGVDSVEGLPDGIDFVFVDFGLPVFLPAFKRLQAKLADGATLLVDGGPDGH
jgi:predicted O-methyltransferase YrrM